MLIKTTPIQGLRLVETSPHTDRRGAFARFFCGDELKELLGERNILQINWSQTSAVGTVRGMHYQLPPYAEMKFVRCLKGRVWDVAVDLRTGSPSFMQWHAEELSDDNMLMMVIPEGVAHGFQVLEAESELLYLHTAFYRPAAEGGLRPTDERLNIDWPLPISDLSERDKNHPLLKPEFAGLQV